MTLRFPIMLTFALLAAHGSAFPRSVDATPAELALQGGRFEDAIQSARRELAGRQEEAELWWILGQALEARGRYHEALDVYRWGARYSGGVRIQCEVGAARLERLLGQTGSAVARLQRVLQSFDAGQAELSSEETAAVADAARLLASTDAALYHRSLQIYEDAIRVDPENVAARIALGHLLLDRYNNTEASSLYRGVLDRDAENPEALLGLARSQHFDHSLEAIEVVRRVLELRPDWVPALVLEALLLIELEDYDAAAERLTPALEVNPVSPDALTLLAAVHYLRDERGQFDEVVGKVHEQTPGYGDLYPTLARIAAQNRRYAEAVKFARRGVAQDPGSWRARGLLGINRLRLGQMETGRQNLLTAFDGDPFDVWVRNTLDLLDRMRGFDSLRRGRFLLVGDPRDVDILAPLVLPLAEQAFDEFSRRYHAEPPTPIRIEMFSSREDFSVRTVGLVGVDLLGVSFGPVVILGTPSSGEFGTTNFASTLWHELAHSFHLWISAHRTPRWFTEGLSVLEEHRARRGWGADPTPSFLRAYAEGRLRPASGLNRSFLRPSSNEELGHAYFQGFLVLDSIETTYGESAVRAFIHGYGEGRTTSELVPLVLGIDVETFDRQFDRYLESRFGEAVKALTPATDGSEAPFMARWREARVALRDGDLDLATQRASEAKAMFPEFAGEGSPYHLLADIHRRQKDPEAAAAELEALVRINADEWSALLDLAELQQSLGRPERARRALEAALLVDPFNLQLRVDLAASHESAGDWSLAVRERRAVLQLQPDDPIEARYELARALTETGMLDEARREILGTLEDAPLYEDALELLLRLREESAPDS